MYGFTINNDAGPTTIACGLNKPVEVANLGEAFDVVVRDIPDLLAVGNRGDWQERVFVSGDLTVSLQAYRGDFLLKISESHTGSETTTGVSTLGEAFDFIDYWAMSCFE